MRDSHGRYETPEVRDVRRIGWGRGLCGTPGKRVDGMFPERPQSFRHQRRPVDNCNPGLGGMAQNGETRGGTFHGEMDRCRGSQGWTTACSRMPERDGEDQVSISLFSRRIVLDSGKSSAPTSDHSLYLSISPDLDCHSLLFSTSLCWPQVHIQHHQQVKCVHSAAAPAC